MRTVRPAIQPLVDIPLPHDQVFAGIEGLFRRVEEVKRLLIDPSRSTVRLVLNPEKMVIKEAQRALTYLNLYGYAADAVVNNRVFPHELGGRTLARWRKIQARYGETIRQAFAPLPVWEVPLFEQEVMGLAMLARMAESLFAKRDPTKVYAAGPVQTLRKERRRYILSLQIPFARGEDITLDKVGDELAVSVGNFRRTLFLPRALARVAVEGATLEAGWLHIGFRRGSGSPEAEPGPARRERETGQRRGA